MLIPQAIVQQGAGGMTLISDQTLGSAGTFDFTGIAGTFRHLQLEYQLLATNGSAVAVLLQFNGDTGANYQYQVIAASATGPASVSQSAPATAMRIGSAPQIASGWSGISVVHIPNYAATTFRKMIISISGRADGTGTGNMVVENDAGFWDNAAAITQLTIFPGAGSTFETGSRVTLYGL